MRFLFSPGGCLALYFLVLGAFTCGIWADPCFFLSCRAAAEVDQSYVKDSYMSQERSGDIRVELELGGAGVEVVVYMLGSEWWV